MGLTFKGNRGAHSRFKQGDGHPAQGVGDFQHTRGVHHGGMTRDRLDARACIVVTGTHHFAHQRTRTDRNMGGRRFKEGMASGVGALFTAPCTLKNTLCNRGFPTALCTVCIVRIRAQGDMGLFTQLKAGMVSKQHDHKTAYIRVDHFVLKNGISLFENARLAHTVGSRHPPGQLTDIAHGGGRKTCIPITGIMVADPVHSVYLR